MVSCVPHKPLALTYGGREGDDTLTVPTARATVGVGAVSKCQKAMAHADARRRSARVRLGLRVLRMGGGGAAVALTTVEHFEISRRPRYLAVGETRRSNAPTTMEAPCSAWCRPRRASK